MGDEEEKNEVIFPGQVTALFSSTLSRIHGVQQCLILSNGGYCQSEAFLSSRQPVQKAAQ